MHSPPNMHDTPNIRIVRALWASMTEKDINKRARPRQPLESHRHKPADSIHATPKTSSPVSLMLRNRQKQTMITCTVHVSMAGRNIGEVIRSMYGLRREVFIQSKPQEINLYLLYHSFRGAPGDLL